MLYTEGTPGDLVGRTAELRWLETALDAARDGNGSTVLVTGEAGIGKTRLVSELAARARRGGAVVLAGRCIDLVGAGLPYLAFLEALRPVRGPSGPGEEPGGLPRLAPDRFDPAAPASDADGADSQLRFFEEVRGLLCRLAAATPLVLILEDLHWADASTLDLACYLGHATGDCRLLIVVTYRDDETRVGDPLTRMATSLLRARTTTCLPVGPLSRDELAAMLRQAEQHPVPAAVVDSILERSGGNPFFAEELLAAAQRGEQTMPHVLRETLLQRVAPRESDTRTVLQVAAAVGRDVSYRLLAAAVAFPEPQLRQALRHAVDERVLVADQPAGTYRLRHALLAEAVYATLIPGDQEDLHGRIARALGEQGATPAELAHHWAAARRPEEALAASMVAARDAEKVAGRAEALAHLERALALWPQVDAAGDVAGVDLPAVLTWAAELAYLTGGAPRAAELIRRALDLLDEDADPVDAALLYERLGACLLPAGDRAGGLAAFERAVELILAQPPSGHRVRVLAAFGQALNISLRHSEARTACEEAIAVAEALGHPPPPRAVDVRAHALFYLGQADESLKILADACTRTPAAMTPADLGRPYVYLSDVLTRAGRLAEAARVADDGLAVTRRLGIERGVGNVLAVNLAEAMFGLGDWTGAEEVLTSALRLGGIFWSFHIHLRLAQLAIGRGESGAARHHLHAGAQARVEPQAAEDYYCLVAELALWEGDQDAAAAAVDDGRRAASMSEISLDGIRLCALGLRAEADRLPLPAAQRNRTAVDRARRRAGDLLLEARPPGAATWPDDRAWLLVAEAEHSRVEGPADPARWRAAADEWNGLDRPYQFAYCLWRLAEALLSSGSPDSDPRSPVREAYRVATRIGARPLQRELGLLAKRARIDLAGPPPVADTPDPYAELGLTSREAEVLQLLALGFTNRQIAARLFISVKTASVHVSHILAKLGVSRRIEAAAIAQRLHVRATDP